MSAEKLIKMGVGLFITVLITRYLGVEKYGTYNFIIAFALILGPLASLGLEAITIKKQEKLAIMRSAMTLRIAGGASILIFSLIIFLSSIL